MNIYELTTKLIKLFVILLHVTLQYYYLVITCPYNKIRQQYSFPAIICGTYLRDNDFNFWNRSLYFYNYVFTLFVFYKIQFIRRFFIKNADHCIFCFQEIHYKSAKRLNATFNIYYYLLWWQFFAVNHEL